MQTADIEELMLESPLDEDDLIEFMTVYNNKEVDNDEVEGEVQLLITDLIRLKFVTSMEQHFLTHVPDMERALKFQHDLKFCVARYQELYKQFEKPKKQSLITNFVTTKKLTEAVNNERNSSLESKPTVMLNISDTSTDDSIFDPVRNKLARLLSNSDE